MSKPRLLVVDDDTAIAREIGHFLRPRFDVEHASSIDEAKARLEQGVVASEFCVVVADMWLSGDRRGGLRLAQDLSELTRHPEVVVLTAHPDFGDASDCMKFGVFGYVEKGKEDTFVRLERECVRAYHRWHLRDLDGSRSDAASASPRVAEDPDERSPARPCIFVSYSHKDVKYKAEFERHMAPLRRYHRVDSWSDEQIPVSSAWREDIEKAMERAGIAVALITSNFLNSQFCMDVELRRFVMARAERGLKLVSVVISACYWQAVPDLAEYQLLPRDGVPIKSARDREQAWSKVVQEIGKLLGIRLT